MLKFIVGGVIVVLAWVAAFIIPLPLIVPTLIMLLVALVIALIIGIDKLKERRAARELERALAAQAHSQAATARPDLQAEIAEMNAEFQKAIGALKTAKKGGGNALYALPWYTIIGPPGSGKSTALRNSGLQFPYLSASGGGVRGLGGTRNCDWWLTNDAVILDTAGRWTSEDEDRDEWLAFLDLVKRFRPKKPLNGVIVAVSIGELGGAREDEVAALARRIRDRIDEVQGRLSLSLPVYVMFTKCDLIPGFVETFGDLDKQIRGQIWGFTAPLTKKTGPAGELFAKHFDTLVSVLEHRSVKRMSEERKVQNREMVYAFPQQLAVLKANMQELVHQLFLENVFKETPYLRGVYFSSGTQEGRPIDRLMYRMAEAFGQQNAPLPQAQVESKSYFLRDVFMEVVFKDGDAASRSPEEIARQRRVAYLTAAGIFGLALITAGFPALSWARNRAYIAETQEIVDRARAAAMADPEAQGPLTDTAIEELRARTMELRDFNTLPPFSMQFGMYQDDVYEPVRDAFVSTLKQRVIGPMVAYDANAMDEFVRQQAAVGQVPEAAAMREQYARLKLHLLLTLPRTEHEPGALNADLTTYVAEQLTLRWTTATRVPVHEVQRRRVMRETIDFYVSQLRESNDLYFPRNEQAVTGVRALFARVGGPQLAVEGIIDDVRPLNYDVLLGQLVGREITTMTARRRVRGAFTRRGWETRVRRLLQRDAARFFGENWVLGVPPPASPREAELQRERQLAELRGYYLHRYVEEWREFINSIEVSTPHSSDEALLLLTQLTSGDPQRLTQLVRQIDYNLVLEEEQRPQTGGAAGRVGNVLEAQGRQAAAKRTQKLFGGQSRQVVDAAQREAQARLAAGQGGADPGVLIPSQVREQFVGFLAFIQVPAQQQQGASGQQAPPQTGQVVTPARDYEEQLEFVRDQCYRDIMALQQPGIPIDPVRLNAANAICEARRVQARGKREEILTLRIGFDWRERYRAWLTPPIEPPVPLPAPTAVVPGMPGAQPTAVLPRP